MSQDPLSAEWCARLRTFDERVVGVEAAQLRGPDGTAPRSDDRAEAALVAAMHAAARGGWVASTQTQGTMDERKRAVDQAATDEAETILQQAPIPIRVAAGEGPGEGMPGAFVGQSLGEAVARSSGGRVWDGVFDYVDGTTLAANGMPGAISLGALGFGVRPVPDLQAYAVLAPISILPELDILSPPEQHLLPVLREILRAVPSRTWTKLCVLTHSPDTGPFHETLISLLQTSGVGQVIVPKPVIIEAPYILSLAGLAAPRIDTMIGVFGLPELAFAMLLLDLVRPDYGFVFRPASVQAISAPRQTLDSLFRFSAEERAILADLDWSGSDQYLSSFLAAPGGARHAAIFAVTENAMLRLPEPTVAFGLLTIGGLVIGAGGAVTRLTVQSLPGASTTAAGLSKLQRPIAGA